MLRERHPLTISQAADALSVSPAWLRFGEGLGALTLARRNRAGWRYYTPEDIGRLRRLGVGGRKRRLAVGDDSPRIPYTPRAATTPGSGLGAPANAYRCVSACRAKEEGGPAVTAPDDAERRASEGTPTNVPGRS